MTFSAGNIEKVEGSKKSRSKNKKLEHYLRSSTFKKRYILIGRQIQLCVCIWKERLCWRSTSNIHLVLKESNFLWAKKRNVLSTVHTICTYTKRPCLENIRESENEKLLQTKLHSRAFWTFIVALRKMPSSVCNKIVITTGCKAAPLIATFASWELWNFVSFPQRSIKNNGLQMS